MPISVDNLNIATIDREIALGFRTLVFSPALERQFEDGRRRERVRAFLLTGLMATILYDLFLFSDAQMIPDVFSTAVFARLGIFTPLFLLASVVVMRTRSLRLREGTAAALAITSVFLIMVVLTISHSPDMGTYEYGSVLIMLFSALVIRLRFRYTITTLVGSIVIQLIAVAHLHDTTPRTLQTQAVFFVTAGILMAVSAYLLEHEQRRAYLLGLRGSVLNAQLDLMAKLDPLTGLGNRRYLDAVMEVAFADADTRSKHLSAVLLDIDHFKSFNDAYGHLEGDRCLQQVGDCVREACALVTGATAIRFGGEEFLVVIDGADQSVARLIAQHIQSLIQSKAIAHPQISPGCVVTASTGIASVQTVQATFDELIGAADKALYRAKDSGRNCIVVASPDDVRPAKAGAYGLAIAS